MFMVNPFETEAVVMNIEKQKVLWNMAKVCCEKSLVLNMKCLRKI